ncbi:uncharacterized protein LOC143286587 [Babylonia areolata]|uniref:uncharacterized protein LOC143286587 n=1 Tax=Babylonia areolata TaxID=304850 RepID=UPI003FD1C5B1
MMSLPPEVDRCLHRHTRYLLQTMVPDGVYVYLSGAKLVGEEDRHRYTGAHDVQDRNHAVLKIVAKNGLKGFEAFLAALEITQQTEIADRLVATLQEQGKEKEKNSNVTHVHSIAKIINTSAGHNSQPGSNAGTDVDPVSVPVPSSSRAALSSPRMYIVGQPRTSSVSPAFSSRNSRARSLTRTPATPPLSESELAEHLTRLKSLLETISTAHSDRHCRQEAKELLGELSDAGDSMMDRLRQLSEENAEKERELRRAKYMVRGMETEIEQLRLFTPKVTSPTVTSPVRESPSSSEAGETDKRRNKSKLCVIL